MMKHRLLSAKHCLLKRYRVFSAAHAFTHRMSHGIKVRIQIYIMKKDNQTCHKRKVRKKKEDNTRKKNAKSTVNDRQQQNILTVSNDITHICTKSKNNFDYSYSCYAIRRLYKMKHMFITGKRSPHDHIHNFF